jgi:uncharacterized radical SAM superfamily Fe-S cluster-containing enzyme
MQRDYRLLESTVGLCPECLCRLDAKIIEREGSVYLARTCPEHGPQLDLLEEDAAYFRAKNTFSPPATICATQTAIQNQCPFDCGLCPNHEQHTCIGLIEITGQCGLGCPVCYAESGSGGFLPLDAFEKMVEFAVASEGGSLDILQLSGGEPTLHPELATFVQHARDRGVKYVLLNTNGLEFARQPELLKKLTEFREGFEVYLQFDGISEAPYEKLRGAPLLQAKLEALELLSKHEIPVTLVASVAAGINDNELGPLLAKALRTPFVRGISFQPVSYFGRLPKERLQRTTRATLSGIIRRLETQMNGMVRQDHIAPLPCDVDRVAIGYFHKRPDGSFAPIATRQDVLAHQGRIPNTLRFSPEELLKSAGASLCSGSGCCGAVAGRMLQLFPKSFFQLASQAERARVVSECTFRITITSFIDAYNFDLRSCQRECVHVVTPDLRKIPFSAYNLYHRQRQPRL